MNNYRPLTVLFLVLAWGNAMAQSNMAPCVGGDAKRWHNCQGAVNFASGDRYEGEFQNGRFNGWATYYHLADNPYRGDRYVGEFRNGLRHGQGRYTFANGKPNQEGVWADSLFVRADKVSIPAAIQTNFAMLAERKKLEGDKLRLAQERRLLDEDRAKREQAKANTRLAIQASATLPDANGDVTITIQTNADTSSLKINGEEQGGKQDGSYTLKRVARVGQETRFALVAKDIYGNTDSKTLTVSRAVADSKVVFAQLNAANVRPQPARDAVAIIIGIQDYKRVAKAEFANQDAQVFYDYASRALGIKPENIKLLVDDGADDLEIRRAFKSWLPQKVKKGKTDVYVFYSGHGLPSDDGKSLYFLPHGVDREFIERTAINQHEIVANLQAAQPKSVTMFIDSCYSGQTRAGTTLLASARPIVIKAKETAYPAEFTVITASANDQISWSSPELRHGVFSYYLMKAMEGDADANKDGRITAGELQEYLAEMVGRQAMGMSRRQQPQLFGDAERVLVGR